MSPDINKESNYSAFLGIGTGKRIRAREEEKRATIQLQAATAAAALRLEAELAAKGFTPAEVKQATAETALKAAEINTTNKLYYILGFVVLIVIVGVVLIKRSKSR